MLQISIVYSFENQSWIKNLIFDLARGHFFAWKIKLGYKEVMHNSTF